MPPLIGVVKRKVGPVPKTAGTMHIQLGNGKEFAFSTDGILTSNNY
jgi:hypothetical protein